MQIPPVFWRLARLEKRLDLGSAKALDPGFFMLPQSLTVAKEIDHRSIRCLSDF